MRENARLLLFPFLGKMAPPYDSCERDLRKTAHDCCRNNCMTLPPPPTRIASRWQEENKNSLTELRGNGWRLRWCRRIVSRFFREICVSEAIELLFYCRSVRVSAFLGDWAVTASIHGMQNAISVKRIFQISIPLKERQKKEIRGKEAFRKRKIFFQFSQFINYPLDFQVRLFRVRESDLKMNEKCELSMLIASFHSH